MPIFLSVSSVFNGGKYFIRYQDQFFQWILFDRPEFWLTLIAYYLFKGILYVGVFVVGILSAVLIANILSSPIYDYVSMAVEKDLTGKATEIKLIASLKLMKEEVKKVFFIIFLTLGCLTIPGLNVLSLFVAAFLAGWDVYDYPLARRGWSFRRRLKFIFQNSGGVLGLGVWLLIPGAQIVCMPLAVVGGTMLALEHLENEKKLSDIKGVHYER